MSDKEKKVYWVSGMLIVGMCLFPPWEVINAKGIHYDLGYSV